MISPHFQRNRWSIRRRRLWTCQPQYQNKIICLLRRQFFDTSQTSPRKKTDKSFRFHQRWRWAVLARNPFSFDEEEPNDRNQHWLTSCHPRCHRLMDTSRCHVIHWSDHRATSSGRNHLRSTLRHCGHAAAAAAGLCFDYDEQYQSLIR